MFYMLSMKIFFQILFVWQENDLVFTCSSEFEIKRVTKKQDQNSPIPYPHTTRIYIKHDKVSISGPQGKGTQIFYKTIKPCVIVDLMFCLYSLRYTCVL